MQRPPSPFALALSLFGVTLAATACSGGGGSGGGGSMQPGNPPPIVVTRSFPKGDAIGQGGGTAWDIIGVTTTLTGQFFGGNGNTYDTLRVDVTFAQDVTNALPVPGQPLKNGSQIGVAIGLDSDGNPSTGNFNGCFPDKGTPDEFVSDVGFGDRLSDGNYSILGTCGSPIYSGSPNPGSEAQTSVSGNVVSQTFFLAAVGASSGLAVPKIKVSVASVNGTSTLLSDCVPTDGTEI
jgi:hypothetical protein